MSDTTTPAGDAGGDTTTSISAALAELPARIRVHALAKLLGRSSRDVLTAVSDLGGDGRSAQSSIDRDTALRVAEAFGLVEQPEPEPEPEQAPAAEPTRRVPPTPVFASASPLFLPPEPPAAPAPVRKPEPVVAEVEEDEPADESQDYPADADGDDDDSRPRRRRGRRGRGRGKGGQDEADEAGDDEPAPDKSDKPAAAPAEKSGDKPADKPEKTEGRRRSKAKAEEPEAAEDDQPESDDSDGNRRRRRRRRRKGGDGEDGAPTEDDPPNTVVHVREARDDKDKGGDSDGRDEVRSVRGSTRLEAKRQRRRDGREAGRRRAPILSEAEFLARREAVDRAMVVRERGDRIQIGVLEDGVLVEHFVTSSGSGSLVGNVYLGRVQNVLPSMEAAFVDIGRGRNAVLYAGEVDWDAAGLEGKARKIEQALSTGDSVLVQVTKDPVGHKGARLTTQISLPGRFLVYVPGGGATGISRKLPENERRRLKDVLKRVVPEDAGVIIRTASEGISEEELARDVRRLQAQWQVIQDKAKGGNGVRRANAPALVYEEPDLLVKVVRDLFTEDFSALVIEGAGAWETVDAYVRHVAPELADRVRKHVGANDVFAEYRIEEQLLKALDRKVWLPSGGYLVIDRTEAMTVIDVNTGKFTGSGGNLEETVTRNNLESAEEIVRQLRLRDIGGIIVIDFIDMVLESNRDLVLRRLTECLGRDRTRHQVAEVTSLGLVQMTRKRVGTGLLEAFGTTCEHCKGRGVLISIDPVGKPAGGGGNGHGSQHGGGGGGGRRNRNRNEDSQKDSTKDSAKDSQKDSAKESSRDSSRDSAKETAAKEAAKAVRGIAAATTKSNGVADTTVDATSDVTSDAETTAEAPVAAVRGRSDVVRASATDPDADLSTLAGGTPAEQPVEQPAEQTTGRTRRRSRRSTAPPSATVEQPAAPAAATHTVPAGEPAASTVVVEPVGDSAGDGAGDGDVRLAAGERNGAHEQANGRAPEPVDTPDVPAVTPPVRRTVRRGGSRPAGPPVNAGHDG
ncbi:ribonuclease E/G [Actinophytocola xinjiangensis]|uniref:Ribonuclease E n=1 Tax=Actinophytocola xinjiangensis TaxID=485602 RepID=A0A7Z1AXV4_9PSEU|nr:translation initiation factor IF-2 N-terminal domain-containing protein [Actinophytocola xinjiangensis]OLF08805.1 ribonuclease E/G [Actinophytocola xinjiangensis]